MRSQSGVHESGLRVAPPQWHLVESVDNFGPVSLCFEHASMVERQLQTLVFLDLRSRVLGAIRTGAGVSLGTARESEMRSSENPAGRSRVSSAREWRSSSAKTLRRGGRIVVLATVSVLAWAVLGNRVTGIEAEQSVAAAALTASTATAAPTESLPPGISRATAEAIASGAAPLGARLSITTAGRYGDFSIERQYANLDSARLVWGVKYESIATPCYPGGACESPRPGTVTVFLDYSTGEFLASVGYFPMPD